MFKKKQIIFFIGLSLFLSVFLLRQPIFSTILEVALEKSCKEKVVYASRHWEGNTLVYEGLQIGPLFYTEKAEIHFSFSHDPFYVEGHLFLIGPKFSLNSHSENAKVPFVIPPGILPSKFFVLKCDIEDGEVVFEGDPVHQLVTFVSGAAKDEIGTLVIYDEKDPLIYCECVKKDERVVLEWEIAKMPLIRLFELSRIFSEYYEWDEIRGSADAKGTCEIDANLTLLGGIGSVSLQSAVLASTKLGVHAQIETCEAELRYEGKDGKHPIWEHILGSVSIQGGEVRLFQPFVQEQWGVIGCNAIVTLDPNQESEYSVEGNIFYHEHIHPIHLSGKGSIQNDASFWMENKLRMKGDGSDVANLSVSLCRSSLDRYVIQADIEHMDQVAMAMALDGLSFMFPEVKCVAITQGNGQGSITSWIEEGGLKRVQWNDVNLNEIGFSQLDSKAEGFCKEAHLSGEIEGPRVVAFNLELKEGAVKYDQLNISDLDAHIEIIQDVFTDSTVTGSIMELPGEVKLSGPWAEYEASIHAKAPLTDWLKIEKGTGPDITLEANLKKGAKGYALTGSFLSENEEMKFGAEFEGLMPLTIQEGWFESSSLSLASYASLFKCLDPNLQVEGSLSLSGEIAPETIQGICHIDRIHLVSSTGSEVESGAEVQFMYHFLSNKLESNAVFKNGVMRETEYGLTLDRASGTLSFQSEGVNVLDWRLKSEVQDADFSTADRSLLKNLQFDLTLDSSMEGGVITGAIGDFYLNPTSKYRFSGSQIQFKSDTCEFDVALEKGGKEVLKLVGLGSKTDQNRFQLSMVHENNHFFSTHWDQCLIKLEGNKVVSFDMVSRLKGQDLYSQAAFLSEAGFFLIDNSYLEPLKKIEGDIFAKLGFTSSENFIFEAEAARLLFDGDPIQKFALKGRRVGEQWIFEKITAEDILFKGTLSRGIFPYWEVRWKDILVKGDAAIKDGILLKISAIEGLLPASYHLKSLKMAHLILSPHASLALRGIDLGVFQDKVSVGRLFTDALIYNRESKKWEAEKVQFDAALFGSQEPLKGFFNVKWSPRFCSFQGVVDSGHLSWSNFSLKPQQIIGFYEPPFLNFKSQVLLEKAPLHIQAKLNLAKGMQGTVSIQDEKKEKNVAISLKERLFCESISGSLCGLDVHLKRSGSNHSFSGSVAIEDGYFASSLFPEKFSFLKEIKNIELIGIWNDFTFQGELRGSEIRLKNYLFNEVHAGVHLSPDFVLFKNMTLADPAGTCSIKQMECRRGNNWSVNIPLLKLQNFRPSKMRKIGSESKELKPFVIRNLIFSDVHAELGNQLQLSGRGSLNFTNIFRKEASFFEVPMTVLKNLGLDLELFTPVSGEVECFLKGNKMFLSNLKNTFSEGKRSQFYLASDLEPSFIDLDGNVHINVRMKQDAVLKIGEPFALTIRGTLEKMSYGLR